MPFAEFHLPVSIFTVFALFIFHAGLATIYRNRSNGLLALGWLSQVGYLMLEWLAAAGNLPSSTPIQLDWLGLMFFLVVAAVVAGHRVSLALILWGLLTASAALGARTGTDFFGQTMVACFSAIITYTLLAVSVVRCDNRRLLALFAGRSRKNGQDNRGASAVPEFTARTSTEVGSRKAQSESTEIWNHGGTYEVFNLPGSLPKRFTSRQSEELRERAFRVVRTGKGLVAGAFFLYALIQVVYPFKESVPGEVWIAFFSIGTLLKASTGLAFASFFYAVQLLTEARIRDSTQKEELAAITAGVEHELRAPVSRFSKILKNLELEVGQFGYDKITGRVQKLKKVREQIVVVMDMVTAIRESADEFSRRRSAVSVNAVLHRAIEMANERVAGEHPVIEIYGQKLNMIVDADSERLAQAFSNIVLNGAEAALERSPGKRPKIEIRIRQAAGRVEILFEDWGVGIETENIANIYYPYYSTKDDMNANRGLGLFISDRIVHLHGGSFDVTNKTDPPGGALAIVQLPTVG